MELNHRLKVKSILLLESTHMETPLTVPTITAREMTEIK